LRPGFTEYPVLTDLRGTQVAAMWRMLGQRATGVLLGWTPFLRSAVRRTAALALVRFSAV
jgi:hypothetical protein